MTKYVTTLFFKYKIGTGVVGTSKKVNAHIITTHTNKSIKNPANKIMIEIGDPPLFLEENRLHSPSFFRDKIDDPTSLKILMPPPHK